MPFTYENRQWRKGWDLSDGLPSAACGTPKAITECNRLREVLGRNCEGKKHAVRALGISARTRLADGRAAKCKLLTLCAELWLNFN